MDIRSAWGRSRKDLLRTTVFLAVLTAAPAVRAGDAAAALALFEEGRKLVDAGDYARACPKFEASLREDNKIGTLLNLAVCYEKTGRVASAWVRFVEARDVASRSGQQERADFARDHAAALASMLSRLTITVASPVPGLEVKRDGVVVDPAAYGVALPIDPGKHVIEATAPGMKRWESTVEAGKPGETATVAVPALERGGDAGGATAAPGAQAATLPATPPADAGASSGGPWRTVAIVVGAAGVVSVGIGSVFGVLAMNAKNDENNHCPGGSAGACYQAGVDASKTALNDANISTVTIVGGGVAIAGAAVLWLIAPKGAAQQPSTSVGILPLVGAGGAGLTLHGGF
jgi:hypothetical protein